MINSLFANGRASKVVFVFNNRIESKQERFSPDPQQFYYYDDEMSKIAIKI